MQKATRKIEETLKLVDLIIELGDARIPFSSRATHIQKLIARKPHLFILTKADLADPSAVENLLNTETIAGNLNEKKFITLILNKVKKLGSPIIKKMVDRGFKVRPLTVMIVGIPNVGKSTLINKLAGRKAASVQNRPGHTRANQYIKVSEEIALIDTPGILAPNFNDPLVSMRLALIGTIRQEILPTTAMSEYLFMYLQSKYLTVLNAFYGTEIEMGTSYHQAMLLIATRRGKIGEEHHVLAQTELLFLNDFKKGTLGRISLE